MHTVIINTMLGLMISAKQQDGAIMESKMGVVQTNVNVQCKIAIWGKVKSKNVNVQMCFPDYCICAKRLDWIAGNMHT